MSEKLDKVKMAAAIRRQAERLHEIADDLIRDAEVLDPVDRGGKKLLRGRGLVEELLKHVQVGQELHYRDAERLLHAAGFAAGGIEPSKTLLVQIINAPEFEHVPPRTGRYIRVEPDV